MRELVSWLLLITGLVTTSLCFPTGKPEQILDPDLSEEKRYPDGTVMGKYSYMDNDGNPIQVKYYADHAGYGVELKSFKEMESTTPVIFSKDSNSLKAIPYLSNPKSKIAPNMLNSIEFTKEKDNAAIDLDKKNKVTRYTPDKSDSDFEVYYQNELKGPECGKEKFRIYFDKDRNVRNVIDNFEADKYCEQF